MPDGHDRAERSSPIGHDVGRDSDIRADRERRSERDRQHKSNKSSRRSRSRSRERRSRRRSSSRDRPRSSSTAHRVEDDRRERGRSLVNERPPKRSPSPRPRRAVTPPEERLAREKERELRDLERATRTIFAYNLSLKAEERDLFEFFSRMGQVTDIKLITDRHTKRSKGLAYIEFVRQEDVFAALSLTGQPLMGMPVMIKASEAEKNLAWEAQQQAKQNAAAAGSLLSTLGVDGGAAALSTSGLTRVMLSNLNPQLIEDDLRSVFSKLGSIESVEIARDAAGQPQGYGFVQYSEYQAAQAAIVQWDNQVLAGQPIRVTQAMPTGLAAALPSAALLSALPGGALPALSGYPGAGTASGGGLLLDPASMAAAAAAAAAGFAGGQALPGPPVFGAAATAAAMAAAPAAAAAVQSSGVGDLEEEENGGGYKLNAKTRHELMNRLAAAAGLQPTAPAYVPVVPAPAPATATTAVQPAALLEQGVLGPASPIPTPCILLRNMFDPASQTGPDWPSEVADDVRDECSKFGPVLHVEVDRNSKGHVYLKFATTAAATAAQRALHGRWYSGNQILADFQFAHAYSSHFKC